VAVSPDELALTNKIDELHTAYRFFGSRRVAIEPGINRKAAQRHMREMGIEVIYPGPILIQHRLAAPPPVFPAEMDDSGAEYGVVNRHHAYPALAIAIPVVWNSDQGSHFTSALYLNRLSTGGVQISMDGKGRAMDNIFVERLWCSLKYEEVYLKECTTPREARDGVGNYLHFYDHQRKHQALGYRTPAEVYNV